MRNLGLAVLFLFFPYASSSDSVVYSSSGNIVQSGGFMEVSDGSVRRHSYFNFSGSIAELNRMIYDSFFDYSALYPGLNAAYRASDDPPLYIVEIDHSTSMVSAVFKNGGTIRLATEPGFLSDSDTPRLFIVDPLYLGKSCGLEYDILCARVPIECDPPCEVRTIPRLFGNRCEALREGATIVYDDFRLGDSVFHDAFAACAAMGHLP